MKKLTKMKGWQINMGRCLRCNRALKDETKVYGPVCAKKVRLEQEENQPINGQQDFEGNTATETKCDRNE